MEELKYPIGKFIMPVSVTEKHIQEWINDIAIFPTQLANTLNDIDQNLLAASYRVNGWSIKQIVHHLADSHMHSYIRMKLAITQNTPTINPYDENDWSVLTDANNYNINASVLIIKGLHERWTTFLQSLSMNDLDKSFYHPEHKKTFSIKENIGSYAWHGKQHLAHIQLAITQPVYN
ncbi:MAG: putative metal-dependent hydrolase [Chitinophagales bacterium]|nr:putative metal-dependent hydrolase [Chitinophagales bacterium]